MTQLDRKVNTGGGVGAEDLVHCILGYFDHISIERVHNLCFLSEYRRKQNEKERYTEAQFERLLDGYYSEDVETVIDNLDNVQRKSIRIGSDVIDTLEIKGNFSCDFSDNDEIEETVDDFGEMSHSNLVNYLNQIEQDEDIEIGDQFKFD